jgi:uncharacterized protein (TIGR02117 family)
VKTRLAWLITAVILALIIPTFIPLGEKRPYPPEVEIFLVSNDIHIEFILPARNEVFNWQQFTGMEHFALSEADAKWIELGWGDRRFYFEMPTWEDFTIKLALNALFIPGPSVMHVGYEHRHPSLRGNVRRIVVSKSAYKQLVQNIIKSFQIQDQGPVLVRGKGYTENDNFYEAKGNYSIFRTCNVWTAQMLGSIGLKRPLWSPTKYGLEWMWQPIAR